MTDSTPFHSQINIDRPQIECSASSSAITLSESPHAADDITGLSRAFDQFRHIESTDVRRNLLDNLFANFLPSDIWHLTSLLAERHLYVDIIALLPAEILIIVLSYVSTRDILSWQRVSKRWYQRLSSEVICHHMRRLEFSDERPSLRPQDVDPAVPESALAPSKLSSLDALRLCAFRDVALKQSNRLATRREISDLRPSSMAYWGGRLVVSGVMVGSDLKFTFLYELFSDKRWKLQQSRESWYDLTISEDICAGVTSLGKCRVWSLANPTSHQERQLYSSNTRDMASAKRVLAVITAPTEVLLWDTSVAFEYSTDLIQETVAQSGRTLHRVAINPDRDQLILLASRSVRGDIDSAIQIFDFETQALIFEAPVPCSLDSRLYRPLKPDLIYVTCSGVRTLTKVQLDQPDFPIEKITGFLTSGDSLVGVPFRDSIFMLEGSYLTRLTLTSYNSTEDKWSYYGILFSLDQTSKMFDLQGDGHYICARMESGILVFSFNLYDYHASGLASNGVINY
ncbi:uncharacterized protein V1516DRAFT_667266 [Lipomyces oligophaga]|uniref:uncharacterized protein n=1 Tax=Lipomyces oligophaga TaxID=45792 RepID=UPI0034CD1727